MELDDRIIFHKDDRVLEINLTDLVLDTAAKANALYDRLEARVAEEGGKWFFLVNYRNCTIEQRAWLDFARRGKRFNLETSLGTVRFNTADEMGDEILRRAGREKFEANLAANRAAAMQRMDEMRAAWALANPAPQQLDPILAAEFERRITFLPDEIVMEADFSDFAFADAWLVNQFYDAIEQMIRESGRSKWYFLVNLRDCEIHPEAWIAYAYRGKNLNIAHSLGSVRFRADEQTSSEIRARAQTEAFDPNLFDSRDAALEKIRSLRAQASATARI